MILCCGETLIDMLPRTSPEGEEAFAPHPGGAVFNTAIALGRLGVPVGLLTGLSEGSGGSSACLGRRHIACGPVGSADDTGLRAAGGRAGELCLLR